MNHAAFSQWYDSFLKEEQFRKLHAFVIAPGLILAGTAMNSKHPTLKLLLMGYGGFEFLYHTGKLEEMKQEEAQLGGIRRDIIQGASYGMGSAIGSFAGALVIGWLALRVIGHEKTRLLKAAAAG